MWAKRSRLTSQWTPAGFCKEKIFRLYTQGKERMNKLLDYRKNARTSPMHYIILALGLVFVFAAWTINPATDCVEYACPLWLRGLGGGLGALFGLGALGAIWKGFEYGSRVDVSRRALIWWEGYPPVEEHAISIDEIATIQLDQFSDNRKLNLLDPQGKRIHLSDECIPSQYEEWARLVSETFPHIVVKEK